MNVKSRLTTVLAVVCFASCTGVRSFAQEEGPRNFQHSTSIPKDMSQQLYSLPLAFEKNEGQADRDFAFLDRASGYSAFFSAKEVVLDISASFDSRNPNKQASVRMEFVGAHGGPEVVGEDRLAGQVNYMIGNRPSQWHTHVPLFSRVRYKSLYPGTDLVFHGDPYNLEFDFTVGPHRKISQIGLRFSDARRVEITAAGELLLRTEAGDVRFKKPALYQEFETGRRAVEGGFKIGKGGQVGFWAGPYDTEKELIIDPVLTYASYFSGGNPAAMTVDSNGNIYLAGQAGPGLLTKNPYQGSTGNTFSAFVSKFDPTAKNLIFSTYIGGSNQSAARALAVDLQGNSYITGNSVSSDFPTTPGAFMTQCPGICNTPFVAKFDPSGALVYSTYTGGSNAAAWGIAADSLGSAYITGSITSNDLPLVNALQSTVAGVFVQKLDPIGSQLLYSTYLGGSTGGDRGTAIAVDALGSAYVTGFVGSAGFPTKNPLQLDAGTFFLTKFSSDGQSLVYSTVLGMGGQYDKPNAITVDSAGDAFVAASITTMNYPLTLNAFQTSCIGLVGSSNTTGCTAPQAYVLAMNAAGTGLLYATLLGDGGANAIAVDSSGNAYVAGTATSAYFPMVNNIESAQPDSAAYGTGGAFVTMLNSSGIATFSTYLAGVGANEYGSSVAVDAAQNIYVAGSSPTPTFPIVNPLQSSGSGFLAKIIPGSGLALSVSDQQPLVAVRNVGTGTVNISNLTVTSETPGITLSVGGTCGSSISLVEGAQCLLSILQPTYPPTYFVDINVSSNVPGSPQKFVAEPTSTPAPPTLLYSPPTLQFPPEYLGTSSAPQTITVANMAAAPVTIDSVQATNTDYMVINNCAGSIPVGGTCTLEVAVSPSQSNFFGTHGQININYSESFISGGPIQDDLFVGGQGYSSGLWASAPSEAFGSQYVGVPGMPLVVTLTNVTPSPLSLGNIGVTGPFGQTTNCGSSLPAYGNCRVAVVFAPTQNGFTQGNLAINYSGPGSPTNVVLVGTGKLISDLGVSPLSFNFYSVQIHRTESAGFVLTNNGTAAMSVSPISLSDSRLSQTNNCPASPNRLGIGKSCTVTVTFAPTTVGSLSATLTVGHSGGGSTQVIPLTGAGVDNFFQPYSLDFGMQAVGIPSATSTIWMNNYGSSPLTIQNVSITGDFQIANNYCGTQIAANNGCGVDIIFTPTAQGSRTGSLTVTAADGQGPHVAALTGTGGTASAASLTPSSLAFSSQSVGSTSQSQTVTLSNPGNGTLNIAGIAAPSGFAESSTCSTTLAPGSSCTISVQFAPTAGGSTSGALTITDDAPGSPQAVSLWGNGTDFSIQGAGNTTATVNAGQTASYSLQGAPAGGFSGSLSVSCTGAPKEATCSVSPNPIEILNRPVSLLVSVSTRAPSRASASGDYSFTGMTSAFLLTSALSIWLIMVPAVRGRRARRRFAWVVVFGTVVFLVACGGGGTSSGPPPPTDPGTPAGTYPITVTASSGSTTRTIALSLTVK